MFVSRMFNRESWKRFTSQNFKHFSRYVRDQCLEAKRYFASKEIDLEILERALQYCLENDTLSFSNLNDTYIYFQREAERANGGGQEVKTLGQRYQGHHQPLDVSKRSLSLYEEFLTQGEKRHESL